MAQWVELTVIKTDAWSLIPRTHMVQGEDKLLPRLSPDLHICAMVCVSIQIHTQINAIKI